MSQCVRAAHDFFICEGYLPRYRVWQERPDHGITVGVGFLLGVQYCHLGVKLVNKRDFGDNRYGYGMICAPLSITTKAPAAELRFRRRGLCLYRLIAAV